MRSNLIEQKERASCIQAEHEQDGECSYNVTLLDFQVTIFTKKATMRSVYIVELNVTVNNIKMSNFSQCFYGEFTSAGRKNLRKSWCKVSNILNRF